MTLSAITKIHSDTCWLIFHTCKTIIKTLDWLRVLLLFMIMTMATRQVQSVNRGCLLLGTLSHLYRFGGPCLLCFEFVIFISWFYTLSYLSLHSRIQYHHVNTTGFKKQQVDKTHIKIRYFDKSLSAWCQWAEEKKYTG